MSDDKVLEEIEREERGCPTCHGSGTFQVQVGNRSPMPIQECTDAIHALARIAREAHYEAQQAHGVAQA